MSPARAAAPVHYRVEAADLHAHLFRVTLTLARPVARQRVSLPVWIPGSYMVREFAKHLQRLDARQSERPVALTQLDKTTWQAECEGGAPLVVGYEVYAFDTSVRAAFLDADRGFFNATSLCLRAHGHEDKPHLLEVVAGRGMAQWELATALAPLRAGRRGFGTYAAAHYDQLADSPVEMGRFHTLAFKAGGLPHRFVVAGAAPSFDEERLAADAQTICEAQIRFWHGRTGPRAKAKAPFSRYVFMLNAVHDSYGGLEHRNSTALIAARGDLPKKGVVKASEGYVTLLGLVSHEYFHTWNVKRLRPAEFARYDYARENHTRLLWFFEGFTSYYDDLVLVRAGLIDDAAYLRLLNKTFNQVAQAPGARVQSVAEASFDAWTRYYRQDENTPNSTISYYTKGALVALCFDLTLRAEGHTTLDDVMRHLWRATAEAPEGHGGPMTEDDFAAALKELGGRSYSREIAAWVHGTRELPLEALLRRHGVETLQEPSQPQQRLGLRLDETGGAIRVKQVLRGGAAEAAGFSAGDEWIGVEIAGEGWRLGKLDDLALYAGDVATGGAKRMIALVARDRRLVRLDLTLPSTSTTARLVMRDAARAAPWLHPDD